MGSEVVKAVTMKSAANCMLAACLLCLRLNHEDGSSTFVQMSINFCQVTRCQIPEEIIPQF
jgi:hypothetical protein